MKSNIRKIILAALPAIFATGIANAQKLEAELYFAVRFDNREYDMGNYSSPYSQSKTLFGTKLTPLVGLSWSEHDRIMVGSNLMNEFGAEPFETRPDFVVYYQWSDSRIKAYGGFIPRFKMIGVYPRAMFSGTTMFYDRNVQGMLLQYRDKHGGFAEFGCDWNSKFGEGRREKFMLFGSGRWYKDWFFVGADFTMHHHAGTVEEDGVVDNILIYPNVGVTFNWFKYRSKPSIMARAGLLQSFQNDRENVGEYIKPGGAFIDLGGSIYGFSLVNSLYIGDNLMPFYKQYGSGLYYGDPFFRTEEGWYNRLELNFSTPIHKNRRLFVSSVQHYDGKGWGWQQLIGLIITIDRNTLSKK